MPPRYQIGRVLALLVTLIGALTLTEYLFDLNLRIDQLLFTEPAGAVGTYLPGRMAPTTATAFLAIGLALLVLDRETTRGRSPAQVLSLSAALIALMAISGYVYNSPALYRLLTYTEIAPHTAVAVFLLSAAVFLARPRSGIARDLFSDASGSVMARRFLPAVFFIPFFLGWIRWRGELAGWYGTELGSALYATSNVVVFAVLVWLNARKMNVEYVQRTTAEAGLRTLNAELEGRVAERAQALVEQTTILAQQAALLNLAHGAVVVQDMDRRIVFWSHGAEIMYGWPAKLAKWDSSPSNCSKRNPPSRSKKSKANCSSKLTGRASRFTIPAMGSA